MQFILNLPAESLQLFVEQRFKAHHQLAIIISNIVKELRNEVYEFFDTIEVNEDFEKKARIIGESLVDLGKLYKSFFEDCLDDESKTFVKNVKEQVRPFYNILSPPMKYAVSIDVFTALLTKDNILFKSKALMNRLKKKKVRKECSW